MPRKAQSPKQSNQSPTATKRIIAPPRPLKSASEEWNSRILRIVEECDFLLKLDCWLNKVPDKARQPWEMANRFDLLDKDCPPPPTEDEDRLVWQHRITQFRDYFAAKLDPSNWGLSTLIETLTDLTKKMESASHERRAWRIFDEGKEEIPAPKDLQALPEGVRVIDQYRIDGAAYELVTRAKNELKVAYKFLRWQMATKGKTPLDMDAERTLVRIKHVLIWFSEEIDKSCDLAACKWSDEASNPPSHRSKEVLLDSLGRLRAYMADCATAPPKKRKRQSTTEVRDTYIYQLKKQGFTANQVIGKLREHPQFKAKAWIVPTTEEAINQAYRRIENAQKPS